MFPLVFLGWGFELSGLRGFMCVYMIWCVGCRGGGHFFTIVMRVILLSGYIRGRKCCGSKRRDVVTLVYSVA